MSQEKFDFLLAILFVCCLVIGVVFLFLEIIKDNNNNDDEGE